MISGMRWCAGIMPSVPVAQGPDLSTIQAMMRPFERQVDSLSKALAEKDEQLTRMRERPLEPTRSPLEEKMFSSLLDGDSARMTQLRENHAAEVRMLKEHAREDEKRAQDRFDRESESLRRSHERELASMRSASER